MLLEIMNRRGKKILVYFIRQDPYKTAGRIKCSKWSIDFVEVAILY